MGYYSLVKANIPDAFKKWIDRYSWQGEELQSLIQNPPRIIHVQTLNLATASSAGKSTASNGSLISMPGRGFAIYFYTTGDATKTVVDGLVGIRIHQDNANQEFPGKHQRGYRGDFTQLFLNWPAQANVSADIVIFQYDARAWQGGSEAT